MTREQLANALRRLHTDGLTTASLEVFVPTSTPNPGEGYTTTTPDSPTATVAARVTTAAESSERDAGGTASETDVQITVRDDTSVPWREYGAEGEAPIRVTDLTTGKTYHVKTVTDQHNGLLRLEAVEV